MRFVIGDLGFLPMQCYMRLSNFTPKDFLSSFIEKKKKMLPCVLLDFVTNFFRGLIDLILGALLNKVCEM